jgi:hypothetical protein
MFSSPEASLGYAPKKPEIVIDERAIGEMVQFLKQLREESEDAYKAEIARLKHFAENSSAALYLPKSYLGWTRANIKTLLLTMEEPFTEKPTRLSFQ